MLLNVPNLHQLQVNTHTHTLDKHYMYMYMYMCWNKNIIYSLVETYYILFLFSEIFKHTHKSPNKNSCEMYELFSHEGMNYTRHVLELGASLHVNLRKNMYAPRVLYCSMVTNQPNNTFKHDIPAMCFKRNLLVQKWIFLVHYLRIKVISYTATTCTCTCIHVQVASKKSLSAAE